MSARDDGVSRAEKLMMLGWWDEAERALSSPDVAPSDKLLESCALKCRKECVQWMVDNIDDDLTLTAARSELLRWFDKYTVEWVLSTYKGRESASWQRKREKANDLTD